MKLIYQHMLGFLFVILTSVAIIGYAELDYMRNSVYEQNFARMDSYAKTIGELVTSEQNSTDAAFDNNFLNKLQFVLQGDYVNFRIYNSQNQQIYPAAGQQTKLSKRVFNMAKNGNEIRIRNNQTSSDLGPTKLAYTGVLVPWRDSNKKLIGIIWIGSTVRNVEKPLVTAKHNLINAFLVTLVVGLILSWILSYYSTNKIKKLSRATEKVAKGDFDVQIPHTGHDEIDQLADNFNHMVRKLKQSNEEVKAQEERRDQFMADAVHEMRTPLTTINGILEGLQYDAIPEESKPKSIDLMQHETKRLIRLVNENLDYEKIRNNQIMLIKADFNASPVLQDLKTQLTQNAEKANDELILNVPEKLPVYADRDRFTQIMVNLIQNAIQFTHDGKIEISGSRLEHAAVFKVKDNGIGMSPEQTKYIFERFFKADPSRARLGTGESGLGLSIVSSLVKQHGGKIEVKSQPHEGSSFIVTLYDKGYEQFIAKENS